MYEDFAKRYFSVISIEIKPAENVLGRSLTTQDAIM